MTIPFQACLRQDSAPAQEGIACSGCAEQLGNARSTGSAEVALT